MRMCCRPYKRVRAHERVPRLPLVGVPDHHLERGGVDLRLYGLLRAWHPESVPGVAASPRSPKECLDQTALDGVAVETAIAQQLELVAKSRRRAPASQRAGNDYEE